MKFSFNTMSNKEFIIFLPTSWLKFKRLKVSFCIFCLRHHWLYLSQWLKSQLSSTFLWLPCSPRLSLGWISALQLYLFVYSILPWKKASLSTNFLPYLINLLLKTYKLLSQHNNSIKLKLQWTHLVSCYKLSLKVTLITFNPWA